MTTIALISRAKLSKINPRFNDWLEKMVAPNLKQRYANASVALKALKPGKGTAPALEILLRENHKTKKTNANPHYISNSLVGCRCP